MEKVIKHKTHKQAQVKNIEKKIEKTFSLPKGSVQINNPNGKNAHGCEKIGTLIEKFKD